MERSKNPSSVSSQKQLAEAKLSEIADDLTDVSDQEALVYLKSRGHECHQQIAGLIAVWKEAEGDRLAAYASRKRIEPDLVNVLGSPEAELRNFWSAAELGDYVSEAAMLRTVEWCEISGFDPWWDRLARTHEEKWLRGGIAEPTEAAFWLFNILRSDYAIKLMPKVLDGYLRSICFAGPHVRAPWIVDGEEPNLIHLARAGAIVFAHHRLNLETVRPELLREAINTLCKHHSTSGGWPTWAAESHPSIETTAIALHALAFAKPAGWPRLAAQGREWLWSVQGAEGEWSEEGSAGSTHLTVLVLDAIALAGGDWTVTFGRFRGAPDPAESSIRSRKEHLIAELATRDARRGAIESYIEEVFKTGRRITKKDIWQEAGYKSRTEFERWQAGRDSATKTAHENFCRILAERPHLRKSSS